MKNYIKPFIKYCIVGLSGTAIDVISLFVLVEIFYFNVIIGSICSFIIAATNNFLLNKVWTFRNKSNNFRKLFIKFLLVSVFGFILTVISMYIFVNIIRIWYILAKLITSAVVLVWNFLGNKLWTFSNKNNLNLEFNALFEYSIVIPAYNEENRIIDTINSITTYIKENQLNAEIIVVNDGSKDNTSSVIKTLQLTNPNLNLIDLVQNKGKGNAVKEGIMSSKSNFVLFADADGSTPIQELKNLHHKLVSSNSEIAIGSRYLNESKVGIKQPLYRVMLGRIGNQLIQLFLIDNIKDTQCGFKLFKTQVAKQIFSMQKIKRFAFDMESLLIAKNLGYNIIEVPVAWNDSPQSRFRPFLDAVRTLRDLVIIKLNLWSGRYEIDNQNS